MVPPPTDPKPAPRPPIDLPLPPVVDPPKSDKRRFFGTVDNSALLAKKEFAEVVDEMILQFIVKPGVKVRFGGDSGGVRHSV